VPLPDLGEALGELDTALDVSTDMAEVLASREKPADDDDTMTAADYREPASEMLEGIGETLRMAQPSADRETACVVTLIEHCIEEVDKIVTERWKA
jgi:hypothetical protein